MSDLELDAGFYDADGGTVALVDQQRALVRDSIRTARACWTLTMEEDGGLRCWQMCPGEEGAESFLFLALLYAWRSAEDVLGVGQEDLAALVLEALERGVDLL
jgi:hypothetical protein